MNELRRLGFAQSRLVRHSAEREQALGLLPDAPDAGLILIAGEKVILRAAPPVTALLDAAEASRASERSVEVFLGRVDGRPVFAVATDAQAAELFPEPDFLVRDLRALAIEALVPDDELGLLATAKSLLAWHGRNGFCAHCGTATRIAAAGFRRECPNCGMHHFPRTDPVAIMLIRRGDSCLLGRGPHFLETMYSCLAGFVEPGETIEDAVRRETAEETGIVIGAVHYHASQPWPFPASLMIGCVAEALSEAITIDPVELADARWVTKDALRQMFERCHPEGLTVPQPIAIAHHLLRDFLDGVI